MMKARLATCNGDHADLAFPLTASLTAIGRDAGNLIQLSHPEVSKRHAAVHAAAGVWTLEDLGSSNGTSVNGTRITRTVLKSGDHVRIGPFNLVFEVIPDTEEWVPSHVIDLSSGAAVRTIVRNAKPAPST